MDKRKTCGYSMIARSQTGLKKCYFKDVNDMSKLWHVIMMSYQSHRLEVRLNLGHILGYNI